MISRLCQIVQVGSTDFALHDLDVHLNEGCFVIGHRLEDIPAEIFPRWAAYSMTFPNFTNRVHPQISSQNQLFKSLRQIILTAMSGLRNDFSSAVTFSSGSKSSK